MAVYNMKTFTKAETRRISSLSKAGKSQYHIARALHTRKQNISTFLRKGKITIPSGAEKFWKDVKTYQKLSGDTHKEAIHRTKMMSKWKSKRVARRTEKERIFYERWEKLTAEERASGFSKGRPEGMSEKMHEDYEDYWETP